jgi:hypothetical protein
VARVTRVVDAHAGHDAQAVGRLELELAVPGRPEAVAFALGLARRARGERSRIGLAGTRRIREAHLDVEPRGLEIETGVGLQPLEWLPAELVTAADRVGVEIEAPAAEREAERVLPRPQAREHVHLGGDLILVHELRAIECRAKAQAAAERRILDERIVDDELDAVVGAVEADGRARALGLVLGEQLVVVVHGRRRDARPAGLEHGLEPRVDPRFSAGRDEGPTLDRQGTLCEQALIEEVDLRQAVHAAILRSLRVGLAVFLQAARVGRPERDVHDAGARAAVARAEVAGIKIDAIEQLGRDDAREAEEVIDERHRGAVDERERVRRCRPAHDEQSARRFRDARQALQRAQSVTARARNAIDLAALDRAARHLARGALTLDDDLEPGRLGGEPQRHVGFDAGAHVFRGIDGVEPLERDPHAVRAGQELRGLPAAFPVGGELLLLAVGPHQHHLGADHRRFRLREAQAPAQDAARRHLGHRALHHLELEHVAVELLGGDRLAVFRGGGIAEPEGRLARGLVEAVTHRLRNLHVRDAAVAIDRELQDDGRFEAGGDCLGRVARLGELEQLRLLDHGLGRFLRRLDDRARVAGRHRPGILRVRRAGRSQSSEESQ